MATKPSFHDFASLNRQSKGERRLNTSWNAFQADSSHERRNPDENPYQAGPGDAAVCCGEFRPGSDGQHPGEHLPDLALQFAAIAWDGCTDRDM